MGINVVGVPNSRKTPGLYFSVILGGPGTASGTPLTIVRLIGNMIESALSGASPSFSVAAGTYVSSSQAIESPVQVFGVTDVLTRTGQGSELHRMSIALFAQFGSATCFISPVRQGGGASAATATLTFSGTASANGTARIYCAGQVIEYGVTNGDTATTSATNFCTQVNANGNLPITAQFTAGVVTITAKQLGLRGNNIGVRFSYVNGSNELISANTSGITQFGVTATFGGSYASGRLGGGTTQDNISNTLTNGATMRFHRTAVANDDTTNHTRLSTDMETNSGPLIMNWEQGTACYNLATGGSAATAYAIATAQNEKRLQLVAVRNNDFSTGEIAAQVVGARLGGDSAVGGSIVGETTDPACNLDGCQMKTITAPWQAVDAWTANEIETLLNNGATPLTVSPEHPGFMKIVASITTYQFDGVGQNYSVWKTKVVTVTDYTAEYIRNDFASQYKGLKLVADNPDGTIPKILGIVTPNLAMDRAYYDLKQLEQAGIVASVDTYAMPGTPTNQMAFQINSGNPQRLDANIPVLPMYDLDIIAANVNQRT